jgi:hypothetical protein
MWPKKNATSSTANPTCQTLAARTWKNNAAPLATINGAISISTAV